MRRLLLSLVLTAIVCGAYSQTTDTLCFPISEIRDKATKLERGLTAIKVNKELGVQILQCDSQRTQDSLIRLDFVNAIATYVKDSVLSVEQLEASQKITAIYKKKSERKNWIIAGISTIFAIIEALTIWAFSK